MNFFVSDVVTGDPPGDPPAETLTRFDNRNTHTLEELELQAGEMVTFESIRVRHINILSNPEDDLSSSLFTLHYICASSVTMKKTWNVFQGHLYSA